MRLQYHLCLTGREFERADPIMIVILNTDSDLAGMDEIQAMLPDLEYNVGVDHEQ